MNIDYIIHSLKNNLGDCNEHFMNKENFDIDIYFTTNSKYFEVR